MILFYILTGVVAVFVWRRHIGWIELLILCSWGFLAASAPIGHYPSEWLAALSAHIARAL